MLVRDHSFDTEVFLKTEGPGRSLSKYRKNQIVYSQGDAADSIFYIQGGKVKVCVVSEQGKEAVIALHEEGDFFGEGCLNGHPLRTATVKTVTDCVIMRFEKATLQRVLHVEPDFSECFISHLLARNSRIEEDLVDQLFNSSEKRLARVLLLMANFGKEGKPGRIYNEHKSGDACRNGRYNEVSHQFLYEQVPQARLFGIQRRCGSSQLAAERAAARQTSSSEA